MTQALIAEDPFPRFDRPVPDNGYTWWYVDAVSDDGEQALTMIAFIGSVFSPYYAWARKRAPTAALNHCALNVALYGRRGKRWAMTERAGSVVSQSSDGLQIGPSSLIWDGDSLRYLINEMSAPIPLRIKGEVRIWPSSITRHEFALDAEGRHRWRPLAPCSRIEVTLDSPRLSWTGHAYWDWNFGSRALEDDFVYWDWSRSNREIGTSILYEGIRRGGDPFALALTVDKEGELHPLQAPDTAPLCKTRWWRVARTTRADAGKAEVVDTLEDTPFYSRSLLNSHFGGEPVTTIHESLSLDRFSSQWVRCLLPFRMPRVTW